MRAITIRQPWASLIAEGVKTIETRVKPHPWRSAIGETIAIHAGVSVEAHWIKKGGYRGCNGCGDRFWDHLTPPLPLGAVVATCTVADVIQCTKYGTLGASQHITEFPDEGPLQHQQGGLWIIGHTNLTHGRPTRVEDQKPFGDFTPGRYALLLDDVRKCVPFPCRGYQGLWTVPESVASNLVGLAA